MKKFKLFFVVLLGAFALQSCGEDTLDSPLYGRLTNESFWTNAEDLVSGVNGIYEPFTDEEFWSHAEHTFSIIEDDQFRAGDHGEDGPIENLTFDPSNAQLRFGWDRKYEVISRANAVLINAPNIEGVDQALKNRSMGEAYFLRAFAYWRLHIIYGGTPLILEEDVLSSNYNKPKATIAEMQAQIESDLLMAADLLPENNEGDDLGRAHSGSAWGLLTKLYVYMGRFEDAITTGNRIISGPYPLADNFADNFKIETENNPEVLFGIQFLDQWTSSAHTIHTTPRPWGGWDFHNPLPDLVDEFEPDDPRMDATFFMPGEMVDLGGERGMTEYTTDLSQTGYHFQKYASWRPDGGLDRGHNVPIIRAADIYLLVAEAKIRTNQNGDAELNAVRTRALGDGAAITGATMEDIIHERRVELAGENQRHFDLMRWDRAGLVDIVAIYGEDRGPFDPSRVFDRGKHYYFAIPQREIDVSAGVLIQNDGY
ncbi:MAG: RagB/SusD family nutrient uptake outer membrane protein [Bacteroidota bacterium]